jgi:hypothetical protein
MAVPSMKAMMAAAGGGGGGGGLDLTEYGVYGWWDASDTATITDAGSGAVSQWNDKSSNGRHLSQATGADRPTTGASSVNGLNVITFASPSHLRWIGNTALDITTLTVFIVAHQAFVGGANQGLFVPHSNDFTRDFNTTIAMAFETGDATDEFRVVRNSVFPAQVTGAGATSGVYVFRCGRSSLGRSINAWKNGGSPADTDTSDSTFFAPSEGLLVGARWNQGVSSSNKYAGDLAEIAVFGTYLSLSDLNDVGAYLGNKWGFTWTTAT